MWQNQFLLPYLEKPDDIIASSLKIYNIENDTRKNNSVLGLHEFWVIK